MAGPAGFSPLWQLEFADSELQAVQRLGADLHLVWSAVAATRKMPDGPLQHGYVQGSTLVLRGVFSVPVQALAALGRVRDGGLRPAGGGGLRRQIDLPSHHAGPLVLELELAQGAMLVLAAQALDCLVPPDAVFRESLFC